MPDISQDIPSEILREVFEWASIDGCARSSVFPPFRDQEWAPVTLLRVSKEVNRWIMPILYHRIILEWKNFERFATTFQLLEGPNPEQTQTLSLVNHLAIMSLPSLPKPVLDEINEKIEEEQARQTELRLEMEKKKEEEEIEKARQKEIHDINKRLKGLLRRISLWSH